MNQLAKAAGRRRSPGESTARRQILDAIDALERRHGRDSLSLLEIVEEVRRRGSTLAESTIRTITSAMYVDAPANHATRYPDLRRVDRGLYRRIR